MTMRHRFARWGSLIAAVLLTVPKLAGQTTTGTIRGYVTGADRAPVAGAEVRAQNAQTGVQRATVSRADGAFTLTGLLPGGYDVTVRLIGMKPQVRRVQVQVGATHTVDFALEAGAVEVEAIAITGDAPVVETRTSEVATNVTQQQVNDLPSADRNFLDLAALAPGTVLQGNRANDTRKTVSFGAQGAEQINVFIDGASYKNDLIKGGVVGQDASRGNPFPRNAIQEFRVITQNYKAEYQKASSGIITATTRSGTNTWQRNVFMGYIHRGLVAQDPFVNGKPDYSRTLLGLSAGGPLIPDRLHMFVSYEGNYQNRSNVVSITPPTGYPALDTVNFAQYNGAFDSPFRQTLLFGKLSYARTPNSTFELSYNHRQERDIRDFGGQTSFQSSTNFHNAVNTGVLNHRYYRDTWVNEASLSFQRYNYNPVPNNPGTVNRFYGFGCCAQIGSNISVQDFTQLRFALRNDFTYTGLERAGLHVIKAGVNLDFASYDIVKRNSEIPRFVYELWWDSARTPQRVEFQAGDPNFSTNNTQIGLYVQDDWSPSPQLTLNLGVRWDYESGMMNYDYVTPQNVVDSLTAYQAQLFRPLDPARYFTDGDDRKRYLGAFQPRLGFSYGIDQRGLTTVFGGWGIFQDRTLFDQTTEERFALQHPGYRIFFRPPGNTTPGLVDWNNAYLDPQTGISQLLATNPSANAPEVKLLPNDLRPPVSQQFSLGVRRLLGAWAVSAAYTGVRSKNVFTFYWGNSDFTCPERSFGVPGCFQTRGIPGFSTILFAENAGKTWYDAVQIQIDRPYRRNAGGEFGWGAGLAYTFAERETEGFNDDFSFPSPVDYPRQVRNDERHRMVLNGIVDMPWAWGVQLGALFTLGTGTKYDIGDRFGGTTNPLIPGGFQPYYNAYTPWNWPMQTLDLRVRKQFPTLGGTQLSVTIDLFNAFNHENFGDYDTFSPSSGNFLNPRKLVADPRRLQMGIDYTF